jgi:DNA polymerase family B
MLSNLVRNPITSLMLRNRPSDNYINNLENNISQSNENKKKIVLKSIPTTNVEQIEPIIKKKITISDLKKPKLPSPTLKTDIEAVNRRKFYSARRVIDKFWAANKGLFIDDDGEIIDVGPECKRQIYHQIKNELNIYSPYEDYEITMKKNINGIEHTLDTKYCKYRSGAWYEIIYAHKLKIYNRDAYRLHGVGSLETLYELFNEIRGNSRDIHMILRIFKEGDEGDPRYIFIPTEDLRSFEKFSNTIEKYEKGEIAGSDIIRSNDIIDLGYLSATYIRHIGGCKKSEPFIVNDDDRPHPDSKKENNCLWVSIFSSLEHKLDKPIDQGIQDVEEFDKLLRELYGYTIICYGDWTNDARKKINERYEIFNVNGKETYLAKLNKKDLHVIYKNKYNSGYKPIKIVYYDEHFIPYKGVKKGTFYLNANKDLVHIFKEKNKKGEIKEKVNIKHHKKVNDRLVKDKINRSVNITRKVITFDFEATYDDSKLELFVPYSINFNIDNKAYFYQGNDCVKVFFDYLMKEFNQNYLCLLGYNSSRFDNYFLIPQLIKLDLLNNIFFQNNSILNIKWGVGGCHTVHDICRFTNCKLETACKDFDTKYRKIGDFDHFTIQKYYNEKHELSTFFHENGCPISELEKNGKSKIIVIDHQYNEPEEIKNLIDCIAPCKCEKFVNLIKYNLFDVLSTEEIYQKIEQVYTDTGYIEGNLFDYKTIGSIIYKNFEKDRLKKGINLPKLTLEEYDNTRSSLTAGRVQCFKGLKHRINRGERYWMLDVKSLYPYVMLNRYYPCGDIIYGSYNDCISENLLGIYKCRVNQKNLNRNVIPKRIKGEALDWTYKDEIVTYLCSVDIKCLIDSGADVEILKDSKGKDDGYYFSGKIRGDILFECIKKCMDIKGELDKLKDEGKPYNKSKRLMMKTTGNALSGKVIENIHLDATILLKSISAYDTLRKKLGNTKINLTDIISGCGIVNYKKDKEKEFDKQYKPIYLGIFIYAYARDYMYRSIIAEYDVIYMDTDSALISYDEYLRFKEEKPELLGEDLGKFSKEEKSELFDSYVTLCPKNYFILGNKKNEGGEDMKNENGDFIKKVYKSGFKGVNLTKDKYIDNPDNFNEQISKTLHRNGTITYGIKPGRVFDLYHGFSENKVKSVLDDFDRFRKSIEDNGYAYVLCSHMHKTMRNIEKNGKQAGGIYQQFILKKIKVKKIPKTKFVKPNESMIEKLKIDYTLTDDVIEKKEEVEERITIRKDKSIKKITSNMLNKGQCLLNNEYIETKQNFIVKEYKNKEIIEKNLEKIKNKKKIKKNIINKKTMLPKGKCLLDDEEPKIENPIKKPTSINLQMLKGERMGVAVINRNNIKRQAVKCFIYGDTEYIYCPCCDTMYKKNNHKSHIKTPKHVFNSNLDYAIDPSKEKVEKAYEKAITRGFGGF